MTVADPTPSQAPRPTIHHTACTLDCPDSCSLEVEVRNGRVDKVRAAPPDVAHPLTGGFICSKVGRISRHLYGEDRLLHPARRAGRKGEGRLEPISWDRAIDLIVERMTEAKTALGGESVLPLSYGGSNGLLTQDTADAILFRRFGASTLARNVCAAPSTAAALGLYGKMAGVALEDYEHARLAIVWGANPSSTGIHLVPILRAARARGGKLVVVDPRRTPLAKQADLHLQPRPGTDLCLALALHRELFRRGDADLEFLAEHASGVDELRRRAEPWTFERAAEVTGVPVRDIARCYELYSASSPAVIRCGWGVERNRNGGSAVAAILALPAVGGKFRVRAGGYTMSNGAAFRDVGRREPSPGTRIVNMNHVGRVLTDPNAIPGPPVKVLFVYNANPLATLPNQELVRRGLAREDLFTVVFDQVMTDTALYADLVLPATTFLEHDDLAMGYGAMVLHDTKPVTEPVGEARSNLRVFDELADRLGLLHDDDPRSEGEWRRAVLGRRRQRQLADEGLALPETGRRPIQFVDVFPHTADRRVHLCPRSLEAESARGLYAFHSEPGDGRYPLALISPSVPQTVSSTFGQLRPGQVPLEMHPDDAAERGLSRGDKPRARVFNDYGEVRCRVRLNPDLKPGVALLPKGVWARSTESGTNACALAPDTLTDIGAGACFNDARVEVEALAD
ncbi:MAG: molybdopterin-dependent oxidoreductase [Acidobacteriota bacterium]|nr:molybdopterin-dependent oxidoreductase [Acidobacteriota bacterium]